MRSAAKFGKNVKAIAVTGTVNSITTGDDLDKRALSASEWLPVGSTTPNLRHMQNSDKGPGCRLIEKKLWEHRMPM